jgi:hypothetical protein
VILMQSVHFARTQCGSRTALGHAASWNFFCQHLAFGVRSGTPPRLPEAVSIPSNSANCCACLILAVWGLPGHPFLPQGVRSPHHVSGYRVAGSVAVYIYWGKNSSGNCRLCMSGALFPSLEQNLSFVRFIGCYYRAFSCSGFGWTI